MHLNSFHWTDFLDRKYTAPEILKTMLKQLKTAININIKVILKNKLFVSPKNGKNTFVSALKLQQLRFYNYILKLY